MQSIVWRSLFILLIKSVMLKPLKYPYIFATPLFNFILNTTLKIYVLYMTIVCSFLICFFVVSTVSVCNNMARSIV